jgi:UDP-N-acetylglucosamine 4-epimerase
MTKARQGGPAPGRNRLALVTGGAGFIGSHLVDALVSTGLTVRVLDDFSSGRRENLEGAAGKVELVEGDIQDLSCVHNACDGVDLVFHLAAIGSVPRSVKDPAHTFAVNVGGTANVLAWGGAPRAPPRRVA